MKVDWSFKHSYIFLFFLVFSVSCVKSKLNEEKMVISFGHEGMDDEKEYTFYPLKLHDKEKLSNGLFSLFLVVRYSDAYSLSGLPLDVEWISPAEDSITTRKYDILLFSSDDLKTGKGTLGIFEKKIHLLDVVNPDEDFFVTLKTTEKNTSGIISIEIMAEK